MPEERTILLGVSGGIAAYKSAELTRALRADGCRVQVVMTAAATKFIAPLTLAALSGNRVIADLFEETSSADTLHTAVAHIEAAQTADILLVAPATADILARFALGLADDFLTTAHLAYTGPVVLAPAMNTRMWEHPATRENLATLRARGAHVIEPAAGELACGTVGPGRLADVEAIATEVRRILRGTGDLAGERILITAGPTREPLDPVRYLSNRSSGRMGFALAEEAAHRGAAVVLVAGPVALPTPPGSERINVETAAEMHAAVLERLGDASMVVMAAAVADFRPPVRAESKLKKRYGLPAFELEPTPDILEAVGRLRRDCLLIGFAAETDDLERNARRKLESKGCDLVVANPVGGATGFDADRNQGLLLGAGGQRERIEPTSKRRMAGRIFDAAIAWRQRKAA